MTNFERLLECSAPRVPVRYYTERKGSSSSSSSASGAKVGDEEVRRPCIVLDDIWSALEEWSSFGREVRISVDGFDEMVKYHLVPYLSAIQIFTIKPFSDDDPRSSAIGTDGTVTGSAETDSSSKPIVNAGSAEPDSSSKAIVNDGSAEPDSSSKPIVNAGSAEPDSSSKSIVNAGAAEPESSSKPIENADHMGYLYYQFNETEKPYDRFPLTLKFTDDLAEKHPGLSTLKSSDLSPYSWIAIAWYPIYSIPSVPNKKGMAAAFLTYHSLKPMFPETTDKDVKGKEEGVLGEREVELPAFAAVTYRAVGDVWIMPGTPDKLTIEMYEQAASSWLRTVSFFHNDFNFFMSQKFFRGKPKNK
ncbi:hypothetical protein CARUB_v10001251mg [Capsella rubella]|uniref:DUF789 family protein n=2 Tax=Capsella rubella TaxID=81985 RepID=R0FG44_9BRAS|nr:hypothetical protein CARUB_v10001251mg [Capsella rubella]